MTTDPLTSRLEEIRRRMRRLLWIYGGSRVLAVLLGSTIIAGALDWLLRLDRPFGRLVLGTAILAATLSAAWRYLAQPLLQNLSDVDLALWIEQRYPEFRDALASTVEFAARRPDERLGSTELRERLIERTLADIPRVDPQAVIGDRVVRQAAFVAGFVLVFVAILAFVKPLEASTAVRRLAFPFTATDWPRSTELQLLTDDFEPLKVDGRGILRVPRGTEVVLYVENLRGGLPDDLQLELLPDRGTIVTEPLRRSTVRDPAGRRRELAAVNLSAPAEPLRFRVVGGDHRNMRWYRLQPVPPPAVDKLTVRVTPPAYTKLPPTDLPPGIGHVQALVGSEIRIAGRASKPLQSARLLRSNAEPQALELEKSGRFSATFTLDAAGKSTYSLELVDREGFANLSPPQYEVRATADAPPEVFIAQPSPDLRATPDSTVPLEITARDDVGLRSVRLRHRTDTESLDAPGGPDPRTLQDFEPNAAQATVASAWELASLGLQPGTRMTYRAEATDFYDLGPAHVGASAEQAIIIVTPDEKLAEVSLQQRQLADELERALNTQSRLHEQAGQSLRRLEAGEPIADLEAPVARLEAEQRQVNSTLADPDRGLAARTAALLRELEFNKLDAPEAAERLRRVANELAAQSSERLPAIDQALTRGRKQLQAGDAAAAKDSIAAAQEQQAAVIAALRDLVRDLAQWQDRRQLLEALDEAIAAQEQVTAAASDIARRTLGKSSADLTDQEREELERAAEQQRGIAGDVETWQARLRELQQAFAEDSASDAERLQAALEQAEADATAAQLREAAAELQRHELAGATERQQKALADLRALRQHLAAGSPAAERATNSDETAKLVTELHERQLALLEETRRLEQERIARGNWSRTHLKSLRDLEEAQRQVRQETAALAPPDAAVLSHALAAASNDMQQAAERIAQREAGEPVQSAQQSAAKQLEQIAAALASHEETGDGKQQADQQRPQDKALSSTELRLLRALQAYLLERTSTIDTQRTNGTPAADLEPQIKTLAEEQAALADLAARLIEQRTPTEEQK